MKALISFNITSTIFSLTYQVMQPLMTEKHLGNHFYNSDGNYNISAVLSILYFISNTCVDVHILFRLLLKVNESTGTLNSSKATDME